jgi:hypothetical protein
VFACRAGPPDGLKRWPWHGPLTLLCQAQPITPRAVSCLGWALICVSHAGPFSLARNYRTNDDVGRGASCRRVTASGEKLHMGSERTRALRWGRFGGAVRYRIFEEYSIRGAARFHYDLNQTCIKWERNGSVLLNSSTKHYLIGRLHLTGLKTARPSWPIHHVTCSPAQLGDIKQGGGLTGSPLMELFVIILAPRCTIANLPSRRCYLKK